MCHFTEDRHGQYAPRAADNADDREPADTTQVFFEVAPLLGGGGWGQSGCYP